MSVTAGWLVDQLPQVLRQEKLLRAFAAAGEEVAGTLRGEVDALEAQLDPDTATPEMLAYLAAWFGYELDPADDPALLRALLHQVGRIVRYRGTAGSLRELAEILSGGPATVTEPGWTRTGARAAPAGGIPVVRVELTDYGPLGRQRIAAILAREMPIGVGLAVSVRADPGATGRGSTT